MLHSGRGTISASASASTSEGGRERLTSTPQGPALLHSNESTSGVYGSRMGQGFPAPRTSTRMFGNNNMISGGQFIQAQNVIQNHNNSVQGVDPRLTLLKQHVSSAAFHNSADRYDPPRCHPNTRVEILEKIRDWAIQYGCDRKSWILWLNGAAGAGKSAIMQSILELILLRYTFVAVASFFLSRGDPNRNMIAPLIPTLAYQLIQEIPETSEIILSTIAHNPLIFTQSLEFQLQQLIIQPLINLPFHMQKLFVIFIDGLDECLNRDHQANLIKVAGNIYIGKDIPLAFVIASRREPQIQYEFNQEMVSHILETIPLDDSKASDNIRCYLNEKFADIKKTHSFRHLLPPDWPSISAVTEIVEKSSNQFIYASTIISYISSPRAHPAQRLKVILDLRLLKPLSEHPFAYLDSLYRHIFSQVENLDQVLDILAYNELSCACAAGSLSVNEIEQTFSMEPDTLSILFLDLTAVIQLITDSQYSSIVEISYLHASLLDFLEDPVRSQQYFLDYDKYRIKLLCILLKSSYSKKNEYDWLWSIRMLLLDTLPKPYDQLQCAFMNFDPPYLTHEIDITSAGLVVTILERLNALDFGDNGQAYQHFLNVFAGVLAKSWTSYDYEEKGLARELPDLCARICQLRPELARLPSLDLSREWEYDDDDDYDSISDESS